MSAIVQQGRRMSSVRGSVYAPGLGAGDFRGRAVHHDELAVLLAPPRQPAPVTGPAIVLCVSGFLLLAVVQASLASDEVTDGWCGAFVLFVIAALAGAVLWSRNRGRAQAVQMARETRALWEACWYCARCGSVCLFTSWSAEVLPAKGLVGGLRGVARRYRAEAQARVSREERSR
ncbi:hypothetical protein [Actinoplanes sp. NPDC051859]|uniref:hypothetical protein n=1 Tax=Actinoplanes sp. NPDC051859 TaxID=3363909 RepID=UPI00378FBAD4